MRFQADHLGALAVTLVLGAAAVALGRRRRGEEGVDRVARGLALVLLAAQAAEQVVFVATGRWTLARSLPLELCDLAAFAAAHALWTRRTWSFELTWYWGLSGTLQAILTPALAERFPHPEFWRYFTLHVGIVAAALYLGGGLGLRPRPGAVRRVFATTVAYAVLLGVLDAALGANYFFLCRKPPGSILEPFGGWPWYLLAGAAIGLALFVLLDLPFRRSRVSRSSPAS